ncbi:MAG: hypothetical protein CBB71_11515 [Rhodopirellula sp. TMED11]|nr:MAG: hypothetical protein CBB71_16520 [Rhodopirellula sp. TMED11]OUT59139.1 MAG: hypothetical protein CBB71_11515 [Rhodopirellula sp. TMED11]
MKSKSLSFNCRKALMNNIGESAGTEIANLIAEMAAEIEELRRTKVSVTPIVPPEQESRTSQTANNQTESRSLS